MNVNAFLTSSLAKMSWVCFEIKHLDNLVVYFGLYAVQNITVLFTDECIIDVQIWCRSTPMKNI